MRTNYFKAFVPFAVNNREPLNQDDLLENVTLDPAGSQWRTIGLIDPLNDGELCVDLDSFELMMVRFNERILPGKVRDEHLMKIVTKYENQIGRKIHKKEYAQFRDQAEGDLLPKAFIRRSNVAVAFYGTRMLVFTSSQKKADEVAALMSGIFTDLRPWQIETNKNVSTVLGGLATNIESDDEGDVLRNNHFLPTDSIVLAAENRKSIRMRNKRVEDGDVQELLNANSTDPYWVAELGLAYYETKAQMTMADEPTVTCSVNQALIFKGLHIAGAATSQKEDAKDQAGHIFNSVLGCQNLLADFVKLCGGMKPIPNPSEVDLEEDFLPAPKTPDPEDDEL